MSTTSAASIATSVPAPIATPRSAGRQGWSVVDAVADHRDPGGHSVLQRADLGRLLARQHLGDDGLDAELGGDPAGGGCVVTGEHHHLDARARGAATTARPSRPRRVGDTEQPRPGFPSMAAATTVRPPAASSGCRSLEHAEMRCRSRSISRRLRSRRPAVHGRHRAVSRYMRRTPRGPPRGHGRRRRSATTASASGCFDSSRSTAAARRDDDPLGESVAVTSVTSGSPRVSVPVLSITTVSIRAAVSIAAAVFERAHHAGAQSGADHDRGGRCEAQRVRARDTTTVMAKRTRLDAGRSLNSIQPAMSVAAPAHQRDQDQPERRTVREPLPGAFEFCASCPPAGRSPPGRCPHRPRCSPHPQRAVRLIVAPMMACPGSLCTGRLSPVTTTRRPRSRPPRPHRRPASSRRGAPAGDPRPRPLRSVPRLVPRCAAPRPCGRGQVEQRRGSRRSRHPGPHLEPVTQQDERRSAQLTAS